MVFFDILSMKWVIYAHFLLLDLNKNWLSKKRNWRGQTQIFLCLNILDSQMVILLVVVQNSNDNLLLLPALLFGEVEDEIKDEKSVHATNANDFCDDGGSNKDCDTKPNQGIVSGLVG